MLIRFLIVGLLNTSIHIIVAKIIVDYIHLNESAAYSIGYLSGSVNSFVLNNHWTFKAGLGVDKALVNFIIVNLISFSMYTVSFNLILNLIWTSTLGTHCISLVIAFLLNFLGQSYYVFYKKPRE